MLLIPSCAALECSTENISPPLCIDLYCGLGGWAEGFLAEGWNVVGVDNVRHDYGTGAYPGKLILQDARTLHGSQFRHAAALVASPPCTEYSYMAMPWKRAKQIAQALRSEGDFPKGYTGSRTVAELNELFDIAFRLQREASEAAGRYIPLVVENVKGAQPWVGRAKWHYGSFYLWGDVPALMPITFKGLKLPGNNGPRLWSEREVQRLGDALKSSDTTKNNGGSWFAIGSPGQTNVGQNPDGRKLPTGHDTFKKNGKPCNKLTDPRYGSDGTKQGGEWWHDPESITCKHSSKSSGRKAASAQIAKIPFPLAQWIAQVYKP